MCRRPRYPTGSRWSGIAPMDFPDCPLGRESAAAVLAVYRKLEAIPDDPNVWTAKVRGAAVLADNLRAGRADAELFRTLATLRFDAPIDESLDDLCWKGPDVPALTSSPRDSATRNWSSRRASWRSDRRCQRPAAAICVTIGANRVRCSGSLLVIWCTPARMRRSQRVVEVRELGVDGPCVDARPGPRRLLYTRFTPRRARPGSISLRGSRSMHRAPWSAFARRSRETVGIEVEGARIERERIESGVQSRRRATSAVPPPTRMRSR